MYSHIVIYTIPNYKKIASYKNKAVIVLYIVTLWDIKYSITKKKLQLQKIKLQFNYIVRDTSLIYKKQITITN